MKQKYVISKNDDNTSISIAEHSEVDKDVFARLCLETFLIEDLPKNLKNNPEELIGTFRTRNMFPPLDYAVRIADSLSQLLADDTRRIVEVKIDDKAEITERRAVAEKIAAEEAARTLKNGELDSILDSDAATATASKTKGK